MVVDSALSTMISPLRLRIGWSHPETLAKGDYYWSDTPTSKAVVLRGGDPDTLSNVTMLSDEPGRCWNHYTEFRKVLREASESTTYSSLAGEPGKLIPYSLIGLQQGVQPLAWGNWNLLSPADCGLREAPTLCIFGLLDLAGSYSIPAAASSYGKKTHGGAANQVLTNLQGANATAAERLRKLSKLEPDWDGYGGLTPTKEAITETASLLIEIRKLTHGELEEPFIAPLPDGGLELEWELPSGVEAMLVIPPSGREIRYLLDEPTDSGEVIESVGILWKDISLSALVSRLCPLK